MLPYILRFCGEVKRLVVFQTAPAKKGKIKTHVIKEEMKELASKIFLNANRKNLNHYAAGG